MFGKPIVTKEMAAATATKATKVTNTSRALNFGGKLLNTFNKLVYVVEGVFDFADYKREVVISSIYRIFKELPNT